MNGIINVYKEAGYTSHDVVARLRGILRTKRIGHTGTLDPAATGVLPVCAGRSTILSDIIADGEKVYRAVLLLGTSTDTYDLEGRILKTREVVCKEEEAEAAVKSFIGEQEQLPPMYSAVKIGGKKLYELARKGIEVERKPRKIMIYDIAVEQVSLPELMITITCSKGTYIRTLCHDIGETLGCGGCMKKLERVKVGIFTADTARKIDEIREAAEAGRLSEVLIPPDRFFMSLPGIKTPEEYDRAAYNGNRIPAELLPVPAQPEILKREEPGTDGKAAGPLSMGSRNSEPDIGGRIRLYDSRGAFIGLFEQDGCGFVRPFKMLYDDTQIQ